MKSAPTLLRARACAAAVVWWALPAMAAEQATGPASAASSAAPAPAGAASAPAAAAGVQQIVVQSPRLGDADLRREATVGMTVLGREALDQHGDTSVLDVLQRLPGITLDGDSPRLRGLGGGYTLILLNGEPAPPGFSLDQLAPGDIERIEIIKGATAEHGGVAGSINVVLRQAPRLPTFELRQALGWREPGPQGSSGFSWGGRLGALGFHLPLSAYTWSGAADGLAARVSRPAGSARREDLVRSRDAWRGGGLNFAPRLDWKLGEEDSVNAQLFVQRNEPRSDSQRSTQVLLGPPVTNVSEASASHGVWEMQRLQAQWAQRRASGVRMELKASAQSTLWQARAPWQGWDANGATTRRTESLSWQRERRYSQAGSGSLPWGEAHTLRAGWELEARQRREQRRLFEDEGSGPVERVEGSLGPMFAARLQRQVVFVQDDWQPWPLWSLVTGLRGEALDHQLSTADQAVSSRHALWLPSLHLRRAFDAQGTRVLRASVVRSLRAPDVGLLMARYNLNGSYPREQSNTPLAADSAGNPSLQPEAAIAFELAYETQLLDGGVLSAGLFHRRIDNLIRRNLTLETVAEASAPRWVSRPANIGQARSSGLEFEIKGRAGELLKGWVQPPSALQLRASLSLYRSAVEQLDDPDARLEGQPPWQATLGFDDKLAGGSGISWGASLALTPAFATVQTDRQRIWRSAVRRLDAFLAWRVDAKAQFRLVANNLLAADTESRSSVTDLDGFTASTEARRSSSAQITASAVWRF